MKDEEMAIEYADKQEETIPPFSEEGGYCWNQIAEAFLAGLKAGRPQWHDLRVDSTDLPPRENENAIYSKEVRVCLGAGRYMQSMFSYALQEDGSEHCWVCCDPIAWCEVPQFKE